MKCGNDPISELKTNGYLFSCSYGDAALAISTARISKMLNKYENEITTVSLKNTCGFSF